MMPESIAAPALSLVIFCFWGLLGHSVLNLLGSQRNTGQNLLLAPAVGVAVSLLPLFWLSWIGLPVARVGPFLAIGFVVAMAAMLTRRHRRLPGHRFLVFLLPLVVAFAVTGWPLVRNGFAWIAYGNDDMANYCLFAERLLHHGLVEAPAAQELAQATDFSLYSWFLEIVIARPGSQLLLAWVASVIPRNPLELFMPLLLAVHLSLVAAAGALVYGRPWRRGAAVAACWLVAVSALTTLGTVSQLIAQVGGLCLAAAVLALAWEPAFVRWSGRVRSAALLAIVGAGFLLVYPEFAPFVAAGIAGRLGLQALRRSELVSSLTRLATAAPMLLALLAPYAGRMAPFLRSQAEYGAVSSSIVAREIFPFFLVPSGLANLWGFLPVAGAAPEPWLSAYIALGGILLVLTAAVGVQYAFKGEAAPVVLLAMCGVGLLLFRQGSGFGLFKLAMFVQPFLLGTVAIALVAVRRQGRLRRTRLGLLILIALSGVPAQAFYSRSSLAGRAEVRSQTALIGELRRLAERHPASIDVDTPSMVLTKLQALYARQIPERLITRDIRFHAPEKPDVTPAALVAEAQAAWRDGASSYGRIREFDLLDPVSRSRRAEFTLTDHPLEPGRATDRLKCDALLTTGPSEGLFNRFGKDRNEPPIVLRPCADVHDHLAFVSSRLGRHYYGAGLDPIGIFGLEPDYYFPDRTMAGLGRDLLFEVIHPTASVRLLVDLTATLKADGQNLLPSASAVGETRIPLAFVGRGSGRVYSPPLTPRLIDGHAYVAVDLGVAGTRYPFQRSGLMTLFGRDLTLDPRRIVALGRNISLVTEGAYTALTPPSRLARFPSDLGNDALEYSGLEEDGWVAEQSYVRLSRPPGAVAFVVKGQTLGSADADAPLRLTISSDGRALSDALLPRGAFEVRVPMDHVNATAGIVTITLRFSRAAHLSPEDSRMASAHLDVLGFEPVSAGAAIVR